MAYWSHYQYGEQITRRKGRFCLCLLLGPLGGTVTDGFCGNRAGGL
jgi:hypothetical protein